MTQKNWFIDTIYGVDRKYPDPYMTRVTLTPSTRWGQALIHIFHRGDKDPDPHDHPHDFWTFPLVTYRERRLIDHAILRYNTVKRFRWHYRPAEYCHCVIRPLNKPKGKIITLIWRKPPRRKWGFWVRGKGLCPWRRTFVPWRTYIYGEER